MGNKAGTDHVIRCVANEFGHRGLRANAIAPGFTPTPMTAKALRNQAILDTFAKEYPLGRVGTSDDIADAATRVDSDQCVMTGQVIPVSGESRRASCRERVCAYVLLSVDPVIRK